MKMQTITISQANALARAARVVAHARYVAYCRSVGELPNGMTGHKTWTKAECLRIMKQCREEIERYDAAVEDSVLDPQIIALAQQLGVNGAVDD